INVANHGWTETTHVITNVVSPLIPQLRMLQDKGYTFVYIAHHKDEKVVYDYLEERNINIHFTRPNRETVTHVYSEICFHIAMMLHSTIFALTHNTPLMNIIYDEKNRAFLELFGITDCGLTIDDISQTDFPSRIDAIRANWSNQESSIFEKRLELIKQQKLFISNLKT
ncbi:MAG: hypothetical protein P8104_08230, partial [Gammaproteobacteria bacterium]